MLVSTGMMETQRKGSSPSLMEVGMVRFGNCKWRISSGRKNQMGHLHFYPQWGKRDSCQDLDNRQQRAWISQRKGTSEMSPIYPHLLPERVSGERRVGAGRSQVDILGWVNGANSQGRPKQLESVPWTEPTLPRDYVDLRDLDFYVLSINKSINW